MLIEFSDLRSDPGNLPHTIRDDEFVTRLVNLVHQLEIRFECRRLEDTSGGDIVLVN
jgi:hypothetical protein